MEQPQNIEVSGEWIFSKPHSDSESKCSGRTQEKLDAAKNEGFIKLDLGFSQNILGSSW